MYYFHNDYNEICHQAILTALQENVGVQTDGYGEDMFCKRAADRIRALCEDETLAVHFLVGGTQTNLTFIAAALRPHQAVVAAHSGHIYAHETGAIEATGHKVIPVISEDGKVTAQQIADILRGHWTDSTREHTPQPKLVYISQPTELGTLYSLEELEEISQVCKRNDLYLYVDGARLGYALAADGNRVQWKDLARLCDAFYIGGTKVGAMFGEAVVIANPALQEDFRYIIKQRGGMLAKGWLIGLQFETLLKDNLYVAIAEHANRLADKLREALRIKGYLLPLDCRTNQVFAKLPVSVCERIQRDFTCSVWDQSDPDHWVVRFCTSWATTEAAVDSLCSVLTNI